MNAFRWPHAKDIWLAYVKEFIGRYDGRKMERARDLFEQARPPSALLRPVQVHALTALRPFPGGAQALGVFPTDAAREVYLAYAKLEEDHGLARHAMACALAL